MERSAEDDVQALADLRSPIPAPDRDPAPDSTGGFPKAGRAPILLRKSPAWLRRPMGKLCLVIALLLSGMGWTASAQDAAPRGDAGATGADTTGGQTTSSPAEAPEPPGLLEEQIDTFLHRYPILRDHPLAQAFVVLVAFFLLAKVLDFLVCRILRQLASRTGSVLDDRIVDYIHGPIVKTTVLLGFVVAIHSLHLQEPWDRYTRRVLITLAVLTWVPFLFRAVTLVLRAASEQPRRFVAVEPRTFPVFNNLAKIAILGFLIWALITIWEADPSGFLASAGIVGIAVGFAAQDTLANLIAGVFIIGDAPYRVGDYITLDSGERGRVLAIGLRSTRILTRDDIEIIIPNSVMGKAKITNEAGGPSPSHRIRIQVGVSYEADVDRVREILMRIATEEERIQEAPAPRVRFRRFGESALDFELLGWIPEPALRGQTLDAMYTKILKAFRAAGIEIPYPKRDLYVRGLPDTLPPVEGRQA